MRFQRGPVDGRDFSQHVFTRIVKVPIVKSMTLTGHDENWRPANHYRYPYSLQRHRRAFFDCHDRECCDLAHYCWTAIYQVTSRDVLTFVEEQPPHLASLLD